MAADGIPLNAVTVLGAALPIAVVLYLMVGRRWGGARAGPAGWLVAITVAIVVFDAGPEVLLVSQAKALQLSLYVLYIIWFALALYYVVDEAGAYPAISAGVARLTTDPVMQLLLLGWVFASFLQGVTGFGVPIAVVAPLLVSLGFTPLTSVVAASLGHAWAVSFGSVASSIVALSAVSGLEPHVIGPPCAALLAPVCLGGGCLVAGLHDGIHGVRRALPAILVLAGVMAAAQWWLAGSALWPIAAFLAGVAGLAAAGLLARLPRYRGAPAEGPTEVGSVAWAATAYAVLLVVVVTAQLLPWLSRALGAWTIDPIFPATATGLGWTNPAGPGRSISVFGHAGALIFYSSVISYTLYARMGRYTPGAGRRIAARTARAARLPSVGILSFVGLALAMSESGMTAALAEATAAFVGPLFPLTSAFIGALGAFMTGSNTHSNVVFGPLQQSTAQSLGLSETLILAAQNAGGAVGSAFAPAKVIVGASTVGLAGREGDVVRRVLEGGLVLVAVVAVVVAVLARR